MERIFDYVKRAVDELKLHGGKPSKLQMSKATFCMMLEEMGAVDSSVIISIENLGRVTYFVYGLAFEERDDISKETMFIVS